MSRQGMSRHPTNRHTTPLDPGQPNLFDPDDAWDEPVPFQLTPRGRRLVDPDVPDLRLVAPASADEDGVPSGVRGDPGGGARDGEGAGDGLVDDARVDRELGELDGPKHARVRALQRAGTPPADIAGRMDLDPLTLAVFRATDPAVSPSPMAAGTTVARDSRTTTVDRHPGAGRPGGVARRRGDDGSGGIERGSRADREVKALSVLATAGEVDTAGIVVTTNRIAAAALVAAWAREDRGVPPGAIRVVLRVADVATGDLVGRAWADRLRLGRDRVTTVPWRAAPGPRDVQAVVRVTDRRLAVDVAAAMASWPA